jgi:hypothetical protein
MKLQNLIFIKDLDDFSGENLDNGYAIKPKIRMIIIKQQFGFEFD